MVFGEAHSCAGKFKVFSSELMLLSLKIINLKGSCFWLGENIEFYNENSNFGKTHFSLERVITWGTRYKKTQTEFSLEFLLLETEETPSITILPSSHDYLSEYLSEKTEGERKSAMHVTAD